MPRTATPAPAAPEPVEVTLARGEEHVHTVQYDVPADQREGAAVRTIYIRREALDAMGNPAAIRLSIARGPVE